jgi:hypothetical protein
MPGTYFNQTGNPLRTKKQRCEEGNLTAQKQSSPEKREIFYITQNSTLHKHKVQCEDARIAQLSGPS